MISFLKHLFSRCFYFWWFVAKRFLDDDCLYRATALTFTSLIALVPLTALVFAMLSVFPVFEGMADPIQAFIFENFVPTTGETVQSHLAEFAKQAAKLSAWGIGFLVLTAVLMMFTIERAMNAIWQVPQQRRGVAAFLLYWGILSLLPMLMGLGIVISSYLFSLPLLNSLMSTVGFSKGGLITWVPLLLSFVSFLLLYIAVPNCHVKVRHGLVGALFSAVLFEVAKKVFSYYLQSFNTYELLYGAFSIVPIFFLWVYWVWVIILLGAEVTQALSASYARRSGEKIDPFTHGIRWLSYLWEAQQTGCTLRVEQLIARDDCRYQVTPNQMILALEKSQWIEQTSGRQCLLSRDLSRQTLHDFYRSFSWQLPESRHLLEPLLPAERQLAIRLKALEQANQDIMQTPIAELFHSDSE